MKSKYIAIIVLALVAGALVWIYFNQNHSQNFTQSQQQTSATPDDHGAYLATLHISQDDAVSALNKDDVQVMDGDFGDVRIYLKDKHQWFIIDGDGKQFLQAKAACGEKCIAIPIAIP